MFSGLHIEMAALKTLGDLLEDSGGPVMQVGIMTPVTANSLLKASHVTRTLYMLMSQLVLCIYSCRELVPSAAAAWKRGERMMSLKD